MQHKLLMLERVMQFGFQRVPFGDAFTESAAVEQLFLTRCLCILESRLGISQQRFGVATVDGKHCNPGGGRNPRFVPVDYKRRVPALLPPFFNRGRHVAFVSDVLNNGCEMLPADATDSIGVSNAADESLGHLTEYLVADVAAEW